MKPERLPIFLRAHTVKVEKLPESLWVPAKPPQWPHRVLLIDVETRISIRQTFIVGIFRLCELVDGQYRCVEEGVFYDKLSKRELNTIREFARRNLPDIEVGSFPPKVRLSVHSSLFKFMEHIFFPALREGWLIAGFGFRFDLSRLSLDWRTTRKGGFALILSQIFWQESRSWISNPYRPTIRIEPKDAHTSFMSRGKTMFPAEWPNEGRLLDIGTLLFALFDHHRSLRDWCRYFREERNLGWVHEKLDHEPSGRVTLQELQYCRRDVQCTQDLLNCAKAELDLYELDDLLPDRAYSPASLGKATFRKMNITPPSDKFLPPPELQGVFMQSYFGGRAETHIRKVLVPTVRLDFLSEYPSINTNMKNWEILTARRVSFPDSTKEVRKLLKKVTLDKCFDPSFWKELRFFALIQPEGDMLPVRAPFDPKDPEHLNIADCHLSSDKAVWLAGPDLVASIIRTGRVPRVLKAVRIVPHGRQIVMKSITLRGVIEIDPYRDDFFKVLIEQRKANESDKTLKHALKVIANSTAYGAFVELNEERSQPVELDVFSGEHYHRQSAQDIEVPGKWYFPALASLITSGGRLLLAMAEKCVTDAGGTWLFSDTDSISVGASPSGGTVYPKRPAEEGEMDRREIAPIPVLPHSTVLEIARRFRSLNPYSFGGDLLKVEDVNYKDGKPKTRKLRTVHGYAISAKRYALMEGAKIVEVKGHGLGYLMSPASATDPDWIESAWQYVLRLDQVFLGGKDDPEWLDYPAMMKIPVSSPAVLGRLKGFCKPFDFVLAPILRSDKLDPDERSEKPILITRFNKHSDEWLDATYYNVRTGRKCRITVGARKKGRIPVKTYREILHQYLYHPESKFAGPDGRPCVRRQAFFPVNDN